MDFQMQIIFSPHIQPTVLYISYCPNQKTAYWEITVFFSCVSFSLPNRKCVLWEALADAQQRGWNPVKPKQRCGGGVQPVTTTVYGWARSNPTPWTDPDLETCPQSCSYINACKHTPPHRQASHPPCRQHHCRNWTALGINSFRQELSWLQQSLFFILFVFPLRLWLTISTSFEIKSNIQQQQRNYTIVFWLDKVYPCSGVNNWKVNTRFFLKWSLTGSCYKASKLEKKKML